MITAKNLKKFNIEGGTLPGTADEELEAIEQMNAANTLDAGENLEEELRDEVDSTLPK